MASNTQQDISVVDNRYKRLAEIYDVFIKKRQYRSPMVCGPSRLYKFNISELIKGDTFNYHLVIRQIVQNGGDINYQIPKDSLVKLHTPKFVGFTAMHFAVHTYNIKGLKTLLDLGADFTIKAANKFTALRMVIESSLGKMQNCLNFQGTLREPLADIILNAQADSGNFKNPVCENGISHFHIACMFNHTKAVEVFLKNGIDVNQAISLDSKIIPGYTPLHFAARYCSLQTINLLLKYNAKRHPVDAQGITPLHLLLSYKTDIVDTMVMADVKLEMALFEKDLNKIENAIKSLMSNVEDISLPIDNTGITNFHIMCTDVKGYSIQDCMNVSVINAAINLDSLSWPGYTPLHFAAHFSHKTFMSLIECGADILAKDADGVTPLDISIVRFDLEFVFNIFYYFEFKKNVQFFDDDKLLNVIRSMHSEILFEDYLKNEKNINSCISLESPIWPGYTLLHLVVAFARNEKIKNIWEDVDHSRDRIKEFSKANKKFSPLVKLCLKYGSDYKITDANGMTPLHLAFRYQNKMIVNEILNHANENIPNSVDKEGVTHFQIAACAGSTEHIKKFVLTNTEVNKPIQSDFKLFHDNYFQLNITAGSTPLHIATVNDNVEMAEFLLNLGADLSVKNDTGLSPIHLAFFKSSKELIKLLLSDSRASEENGTAEGGLSNLHIACYVNHLSAIKSYLRLGIDVNLSVNGKYENNDKCDMVSLEPNFTPLHFAFKNPSIETIKLLVDHGANICAKSESGWTPLYMALNWYLQRNTSHPLDACDAKDIVEYFYSLIDSDSTQFNDHNGITLLHLACMSFNKTEIIKLLKSGADINAQINNKSPILPGYTPLHVLLKINICCNDEIDNCLMILKLLLEHGADVNVKNMEGDTAVHMTSNCETDMMYDALLEHNISSINPTNNEGFSRFHIACLSRQSKFVEKYLKCNIDVNQATDYFAPETAGYTALHLAMMRNSNDLVEVLLKYGADVNVMDRTGQTPLHNAMLHLCVDNVKILLNTKKVNVNARTILGKTPIEVLNTLHYNIFTRMKDMILKLLLCHGALINIYNPVSSEGIFGLSIGKTMSYTVTLKIILANASDLRSLDSKTGRNVIHNAVSIYSRVELDDDVYIENYASAIGSVLKLGVDVDHRDYQGKTPLHLAVEYNNVYGIESLFMLGADINKTDNEGKSPFDYCLKSEMISDQIKRMFSWHLHKMVLFNIYLNESNKSLYDKLSEDERCCPSGNNQHFCDVELTNMRRVKIVSDSISLSDMLLDKTIANYPMMPKSKREAISEYFFNSMELYLDFPELGGFLYLQLRKALARVQLIEPAKYAVGILAGTELPDPCSENVLRFLSNRDLKSLIELTEVNPSPSKRRRVDG